MSLTYSVNWLDVYACNDSCVDSLVEDKNCDEIDSLPFLSSDPPSSGTYTSDPTLELKPLPDSLKYVFLGPNDTFPIIIASDLTEVQGKKLLKVLRENKEAIKWTLGDIKDISPSIVQHRIHLEDATKPYRDHQRLTLPYKKSSKKR